MSDAAQHGDHGADHGHDHHGPSFLQHHFDSPLQQFDSTKLGMWLFLATEILLFGGMFCAYSIYRGNHPEIFHWAHVFLDTQKGAINTVILLCSSLTMAWAVRAAQLNQQRLLIVLLSLTLLGGGGFMGIKYFEYKAKWEHGLLWARSFHPEEHSADDHGEETATAEATADSADDRPTEEVVLNPPVVAATTVAFATEHTDLPPPGAAPRGRAPVHHEDDHGSSKGDHKAEGPTPAGAQVFFSIYFLMTGLHGLHVLIGMAAIGWVLLRSAKGHFNSAYFTPVDLVGLYWHLVDLIWIFLFPLLYLIG